MRAALVAGLGLGLSLAGACGGRSIQEDGFGGDDLVAGSSAQGGARRGSGGSPSNGATSSSGTSSTRGGTVGSSGATSLGGKMGFGATPSFGGTCMCPAIACGPGSRPVANADGCCFHCESTCQNVDCPAPSDCGPGGHFEMRPDQCCLSCVVDSCEQRQTYLDFRKQLLAKYSSIGCNSAADCSVYYEKNECAVSCGVAIPTLVLRDLESNLQSVARMTCSAQCPSDVPRCRPPQPVRCVQNRCQF